jgi:hypothetical protein
MLNGYRKRYSHGEANWMIPSCYSFSQWQNNMPFQMVSLIAFPLALVIAGLISFTAGPFVGLVVLGSGLVISGTLHATFWPRVLSTRNRNTWDAVTDADHAYMNMSKADRKRHKRYLKAVYRHPRLSSVAYTLFSNLKETRSPTNGDDVLEEMRGEIKKLEQQREISSAALHKAGIDLETLQEVSR